MLQLLKVVSDRRYLLRNFVLRDLRVKYRGTVFGYLWSLLEPLSLVLIYWFVFQVIAKRGGTDYPVVVILGVLHYNLFGGTVQAGASALVSNAALIRRVFIPRELFIVASTLSNFVVYALSMLVVIPFLLIYDVPFTKSILLLPVAVGCLLLFSTGIALFVSCANIIYRDVGYVIRVGMRLLFYGCPVIYPIEMVPEGFRDIYLANPLSVYIALARSAVMGSELVVSNTQLATAGAMAFVVFIAGTMIFRKWETRAVRFL